MRRGTLVSNPGNRVVVLLFCFAMLVLMTGVPAVAQITVSVTGPGGSAKQTLPDEGGSFDMNIPLNKNAVNTITVTATDTKGNSASQELKVTQVALDEIVVSQITATRLSVEEVEQLVNEGIIDLADPANYNVSTFDIVLTIADKPVPIRVPVAVPITEEETGYEVYKFPKGDASSGGKPNAPPPEVIVFDQVIPGPPGEPPISIPGVLVIEGKIKSLKEFFSVRLLLMNTSGIFTLTDITAEIEFPEGGLTAVSPKDGIISFGEILPGEGNQPGQKEKEYIIRGDEIGFRDVKVNFGGLIRGPGIPEDTHIPFNGSAQTEVEVKGPPTFKVEVTHPDSVVIDVPYELKVDITNTADIPAMYASLSIALGADGVLVKCTVDDLGEPICEEIEGEDIRNLGHILPGQKVSQTFTVKPLKTGVISSCMGASDQNISLQVYVGNIGCMVGQFPPAKATPDGSPTVSVLPTPNATGMSTDTPVAAFFSELMNEDSITTGPGGSFNVFNSAGNEVWGRLRFISLPANDPDGKTVAIWQPSSGSLPGNKKYTVILTTDIKDLDGKQLASKWESTFTTTGSGLDDTTPPTVSLSIDTSVNPSYVLPGQIVKVDTYTADQGSGVARVEARLKDLDEPDSKYELIDQKTVFAGDTPPFIFSIDSSNLGLNHAYQFRATVYDGVGNVREATIAFRIAPTAEPPTITLPENPTAPVLHGISVDATPLSVTGGVREVRFYLDGAANPFRVISVAPYRTMLGTLGLTLGQHTVRAVALDPLGQSGEDTLTFTLAENLNMPSVNFGSAVDGAQYVIGEAVLVKPTITDPVGLASVSYYLDSPTGELLYTGFAPIMFDTTGRDFGNHTIYVKATNNLGISNDTNDPDSSLQFNIVQFRDLHPPEVAISNVTYPQNGQVTVTGQVTRIIDDQPAGAAGGARVDITNTSLGTVVTVYANAGGAFSAAVPGQGGQSLSVVAYDYDQSPNPSPAKTAAITAAPVLLSISASPQSWSFNARNAYKDIIVTGYYDVGPSANVTSQASFSSSNPAVASVNAAGRVVALSAGTATITATVSGLQAQVSITCAIIDLLSISVAPADVSFIAINQTQQLSVTGHYTNGTTNWSEPLNSGNSFVSGNPNVATVSASGLIRAIADGATQISVSHSGVAPASVAVNINTDLDPAPSIEILNPANGTSVERGQSASISVKATDTFGGVAKISLSATGQTMHSELRQISPASLSTTQTFSLPVSTEAAIGGTIVVNFIAEDTGENTSPAASITLIVADFTGPAVSITAPANQTRFNYGDTVNIAVSAADMVGVTRIRYEASGAVISSGAEDFVGGSLSADATFSFDIPFGVQNPDIRIIAYARDAAGNERASAPVDIIITNADIVAPSTHVTSVIIAPGSAIGAISYEITSGLEDLDHVELYFRRNALGTFNRYTDADGGNPLGEYAPLGGSTGAITFDSTKMGGDGNYEFYTIGVDVAGNREVVPMSTPASPLDYQGLVAFYPFNGNALDETGGGNDGAVSGSILAVDRFGQAGKAMQFDGSDDYILLGNPVPAALQLQNELTLAAWIYVTQYPGSGTLGTIIGSQHDPTAAGYAIHLDGRANPDSQPSPAGHLHFQIGNGSWHTTNANAQIPLNEWVLVTATRKANEAAKIYYNGIQQPSTSVAWDGAISYTDAELDIGRQSGFGNRYFNGIIDDVQVYNHALTAEEILNLTSHLVADQTGAFAAGTQWTTINSSTTIAAGNSSYDNGNLRISGSGVVVTVDGPHTFHNVEVLNGAVLTHSDTTTTTEYKLDLNVWTLSIDASSRIDVTGRGYLGGKGDYEDGRTLGNVYGSIEGAGGSYGGLGGGYEGRASNGVYGYLTDPEELGSGGGAWGGPDGGDGGGLIKMTAINIVMDGAILANGGESDGSASGDGSGGGINLSTTTISGTGAVLANGGGNGDGSGAGGGRIAIGSIDMSTLDSGNVQALGGFGQYANGANGTVVFIEQNKSALVLSGQGPSSPWIDLTIPPGYIFDSVTLRDNARVIAHDTFTVTGKLTVTGKSILTHNSQNENGLVINAKIVQVDENSFIDTTGRGYLGGKGDYEDGRTLGNVYGAHEGAGGSYGGIGSKYQSPETGPIYGDPKNPVYLGSGGGAWGGTDGGDGGGRITINASDAVIVNGGILANGGESDGSAAGDGSGGTIAIHTSKLSGSGYITAHGGGNGTGTGGGGGRIAIYCDYVDPINNLGSLYHIAAFGKTGQYDTRQTTPGTVYIKYSDQEDGDLYIDAGLTDANGNPNRTSADSIVFPRIGFGTAMAVGTDTLTTDGLVSMYPNSLIGIRFNPDINQSQTFVILSNTGNTITVATPNEHGKDFAQIAASGKTYAASYTFDNVYFRRGGNFMLGDLLEVTGTMFIEEYGKLTGYNATANSISWINLKLNNLNIDGTGSIDASGRGYLGGKGDYEDGRTLGNVYGAQEGAGGSYGGFAVSGYQGAASNPVYGSLTNPMDLGSGGGAWGGVDAGNGGGLVLIQANNIQVEGAIFANGAESDGSASGDGSGGTVNITVGNLSGTGRIEVNGGGKNTGTGAGGGRIAIFYSGSISLPEQNISAIGGTGQYGSPAGNGTVLLKGVGQTYGNLIIDGFGFPTSDDSTRIPGGYTFDNITIRNAARVVADAGIQVTGKLHITGNSTLTHGAGNEEGLRIFASTIQIDEGSSFNATGRGYLGGKGDYERGRTLGNVYGADAGAGGSYGGIAVSGYEGAVSNPIYGSLTDPMDLGSGGGAWGGVDAGNGGGLVFIQADTVLVNGKILANGAESEGSASGDGSGGTVNINTGSLSGIGFIQANGGGENNGVGAGGGRIAINYSGSISVPEQNISAIGGTGQYGFPAGNGTVYLKNQGQTYGDLIIDGYGRSTPDGSTRIPKGYTFDNITMRNAARVIADDGIQVADTLLITGNSILTHGSANEDGLVVSAPTIQIDAGSSIDVSGRGYLGGKGDWEDGRTLANVYGAIEGAGGSYGGTGGGYEWRSTNPAYGDPKNPISLGSGGGAWGGVDAGDGGGRVTIQSSDLTINGAIRTNGQNASSISGGGSGGSILIHTSTLAGTGIISANGGGSGDGVGGGGGRIAIYCDSLDPINSFAGLRFLTAFAGKGQYDSRAASSGTVFIKYSGQPNGDLYLDANVADAGGNPNGTASQPTYLNGVPFGTAVAVTGDTLTTDGLTASLTGGLVGLRINPDISQEESFVITANEGNILTVITPNENHVNFSDIAGAGKIYGGVHTYQNLFFRRGGFLITGDSLKVPGTLRLEEYGKISHLDATTTFISWLDLEVGDLIIDANSRIDATGRGYLGGKGDWEPGRTLNNAYGSERGAGGSYGGLGGYYDGAYPPNVLYGDADDPGDLGSGGGAWGGTDGGDGGGLIVITASNITLDGQIVANGGESDGSIAGDGSGGAANIKTGTLAGTGHIYANGGGNGNGVGGGGGRIAVRYTNSISFPAGNCHVSGGTGNYGTGGTAGSINIYQ